MPEIITQPIIQETPIYKQDILTVEEKQHVNMYGLNTNLTNSNKWFAYLPLENILGRKYQNLDLHLTRFSLPQMEMGSMEVAFRGYKKQIPTKIMNAETKELTLEYLVDADWRNYKSLFAWMSGVEGTFNPTVQNEVVEKVSPLDYLPLRIYLLSPYKKKLVQFVFENCWIRLFNDIALEQNNPNEVTHSFTCVYDNYTIEDI